MGFLEVFLFMVIMVLAGRQGISDFGSEGWVPCLSADREPLQGHLLKSFKYFLEFFLFMVIMVLAGKQATGYLPAGREFQISALRVGGSLPVGG